MYVQLLCLQKTMLPYHPQLAPHEPFLNSWACSSNLWPSVGGGVLLSLLDVAQMPGDLLHHEILQIKQGLDRHCDLFEWLGGNVQHLLHDFSLADPTVEDGDVVGEARGAHGEIINTLSFLESYLTEFL
jgi:hypothetical protein